VASVEVQGTNAAALTRVASCDDVLERLQQSTIDRLLVRAEELRQPPPVYGGEPGVIVETSEDLAPLAPSPMPAGGNPAASANLGADQAAAGPVSDSGFSGTTLQVASVDEPDSIKTDGDFLYVLQGSTLVKLRAWPIGETTTVSTVALEGYPYDMFERWKGGRFHHRLP
jgi:hypothetical protein